MLDPVQDADTVDGANELQRTADRSAHVFALYPCQVIAVVLLVQPPPIVLRLMNDDFFNEWSSKIFILIFD